MISLFSKYESLYLVRRNNSGYRCRFVQFSQKFKQYRIELIRPLHHRRMATLINKMQLTVRDQLVEFLTYKWRGDRVVVTPDQQRGRLDLVDLFTQVVSDSIFGESNDLDGL